ncbi:ATP11 [Macleaya cordata]|uniref:ATP11 n=1 Tax=Macleaya cordata TaxID=56857 RepID=A0A200QYS8_MACCD|nr:ATP11 [Macleaya cordata]
MPMMRCLSTKFSRSMMLSVSNLLYHASSSSSQNHSYSSFTLQTHVQPTSHQPKQAIPGDFLKWGSLGFCRNSRFASGFTPLQPKPLDSIIDIERAKTCSPEDLASIWDDYHLGRGHIGATMEAKLYHLMEQRAIPCRYFVIPLWRGSGYTTMFVQVQMPHILFTGLEDYKARGTQAAPYFTATYFTEFAESKDMVLIRGDIVFTSKLTDSEAQWLLETTQSFYLNDVRYKLVERFNRETQEFEFKDVLQALEMPMR